MFSTTPRLGSFKATKSLLQEFSKRSNNNTSGPKPAFETQFSKSRNDGKKNFAFDKNMPVQRRLKAWEREGEDKDEFFRRKYAHKHVQQKQYEEEKGIIRKNRFSRNNSTNKESLLDSNRKPNLKKSLHDLSLNPMIEYLYGTNSVLAALRAERRPYIGNLYINNPKDSKTGDEILKLAKDLKIKIKTDSVNKNDLNLMTRNGVHNGYVLETKPFEIENIYSLGSVKPDLQQYEIIKNTNPIFYADTYDISRPIESNGKFPLGLYLDEISDPHNIGAIIRSAYFLGVDFIVVSEKNCAPLSPVVSKTSSGALEFMNIYSSRNPLQFFEETSKNGWNIISTVSPNEINKYGKDKKIDQEDIHDILSSGPCLLVVGSEGKGIRTNLIKRSEYTVSLNSSRDELDESVDSLNASVATALFLQKIIG